MTDDWNEEEDTRRAKKNVGSFIKQAEAATTNPNDGTFGAPFPHPGIGEVQTERDELVERVARVLCTTNGGSPERLEPGDCPGGRSDDEALLIPDGRNDRGEFCHFEWRAYELDARAAIAECEKVSTVEIEKLKDGVDAMKHFYLLVHNRANKLDAEAAAMREALKHADSFIKNIRVPQNSLQVVLQINDGGIVLNAITSALSPDAGQRVLAVVKAAENYLMFDGDPGAKKFLQDALAALGGG